MPEKSPPMLAGRVLSTAELQQIRQQLEEFDSIQAVDDDMRALIESEWPDLVSKLPPKRG
jgi:hypothetical protein